MKRPLEILDELNTINTIVNLTGIFEGIASLRISQIKNQVLQSQEFFDRLWNIYRQIRVDGEIGYGRSQQQVKDLIDKELYIVITAEGSFSGDIDQKLLDWMLRGYKPQDHDLIVIGRHGANQLAQRGIEIKKYYKLPAKDRNIDVGPIISEVQSYKTTTAWYQTYVSLMVQDVKKIGLRAAVEQQGSSFDGSDQSEIISEDNYIFEPSTFQVVDHLERSMLGIALSQIILESKLAQYASRFRAMSAANDKSKETQDDTRLSYNRARRHMQDERLKEIMAGLRKARA